MNEREHISTLVERFLDGSSTQAEEQAIYAYFATHSDVGELECYRAMFGWYASLPQPAAPRRRVRRRVWWSAAGVAAATAVAVWAGLSFGTPRTAVDSELYARYRGSYVVQDGKRITDLSVIYPCIMRAEATADSLNAVMAEADSDFEEAIIDEAIRGISDHELAARVRAELLGQDI
ncbi:MAG: hypothetical protein NC418_11740 [Muribaculaceae bacterium]|nr:hypothetical protein [Muribaculaceae bacterium]